MKTSIEFMKEISYNFIKFFITKSILVFGNSKNENLSLTKLSVNSSLTTPSQCSIMKFFKESLSNSIYHTDENLKDFMEWLKKQDFYKDTVIVIQGDHTSMAAEYIHDTYASNYDRRVWNAFIHSRVKPKKEKNRDFTTMDFYPTILTALGYKIKGDKLGLGTNLFGDKRTLTEEIDANRVDKEIKRNSTFYRRLM